MNKEEVKRKLQITTDKHDDYFDDMIPDLIEYVMDYCNNSFGAGVEPVLPGGARLFIAKALEYNMKKAGVSSRSMGSVSYSYETDFPPSVTKLLAPYRRVVTTRGRRK